MPVPQIETAMHIGAVSYAVTDAAKRIVVTTGQDATARVWSLPDLRLLRVLRPPIGWPLGPQVALTPDGKFAALSAGAGALIYDLSTGSVVRVIPLSQSWGPVNSLAISPDGNRVAFARGPNGDGCWLFVFSLQGRALWQKCGLQDQTFKAAGSALSFAPDGRLAASNFDAPHSLSLFDLQGNLLKTQRLVHDVSFDALAFSPDGRHLAVAYRNLTVEVRDGTTLTVEATPDVHELTGMLPTLAWSADGNILYAAGMRSKNVQANFGDRTPIYSWSKSGAGSRSEALIEQYRHHSISALPNGKLFLVSNWRTPTVLNPDDTVFKKSYPDGADLRTAPPEADDYFRLSNDGRKVELITLDRPGEWLHVDVNGPSVERPSAPEADLVNWTIAGVKIEQKGLEEAQFDAMQKSAASNPQDPSAWFFKELTKYGVRPRGLAAGGSDQKVWMLNGHMLKLVDPICESAIAAVPPRTSVSINNKRVLTVTCGGLLIARRLDGGQLWSVGAGGSANFVTKLNQSPDGRLIVTAHADGTIRWRRASDGRLLLTLYVDRTGDRWVFFTPSGYYYASPDAEKFVGWVVRREGVQAADFFSLGQFKEVYRHREVVTRVLSTLDEAEAIRQAGVSPTGGATAAAVLRSDLPPVVAITAPVDNGQIAGPDATISFILRSPSGREVRDVVVQVDGRPISLPGAPPRVPPGAPDSEARGQVVVPVPLARTVTVSIVASTDSGRRSQPAWLRLHRALPQLSGAPSDKHGRLFALVIGASQYSHLSNRNLPSAAKDASEVARLLGTPDQLRLYSSVDIKLLSDGAISPTRAATLDGLRWLREHATQPDDVALVYIASHGYGNGEQADSFRIVPADGDLRDLNGTTVSGTALLDELRPIPGRVVLFLDTCHSGGVAPPDMNPFAADAADPWVGTFIYASSSIDESSYEDESIHHGRFTEKLIDALGGRDTGIVHDGVIRTDDLRSFLREQFRNQGAARNKQTPAMEGPPLAPDFPIFAVVPSRPG